MFRVYQNTPLEEGALLELEKEAVHHLLHVLRMKSGDRITLFNGQGNEYEAELEIPRKSQVMCRILKMKEVNRESSLPLHLVQGIARSGPMDFALQKAVELGVHSITPLLTQRSHVSLKPSQWEQKIHHWQKVLISACEQCGRNTIPRLNPIISFPEWIAKNKEISSVKIFLCPQGTIPLREVDVSKNLPIEILVGPEAGWSEEEMEMARQAQCLPVSLGPRILRTETVPIVVLGTLQMLAGDLLGRHEEKEVPHN